MQKKFSNASGHPRRTRAEIFLDKHKIKYKKDKQGRLVVQDMDLSYRGLEKLPDLTNVVVEGELNLSGNRLTSLKGLPQKVEAFDCSNNPKLASLEGGPRNTYYYICSNCPLLEDLHGGPVSTDYFECNNNKRLKSIVGAPDDCDRFESGVPAWDQEMALHQKARERALQQVPPPGAGLKAYADAEVAVPASTPVGANANALSAAEAERISLMYGLIRSHLNIAGFDESHIHVKKVDLDGQNQLRMTLDNDHDLLCGKKPDGGDFIGAGKATALDRKDAEAVISLAASRGWKEIKANGSDEHKALLVLEAERQGVTITNPPPAEIIAKARLAQQQAGAARPPASSGP
jgi:hypothetical protein